MKRILPIICITCIALILTFGCAVNTNDEDNPLLKMDENPFVGGDADEPYNFELALVQTPSEITSYDAVYIDFDSIEVSQEKVYAEWKIVNEDGGIVDLLYLAGGGSHTLAIAELEPGQYHQVRFNVNRVWMVVNGSEIEVEIPSKTMDFMMQFSIVEGDVTEIAAEIDFYQSFTQYEKYEPLCGFGRYFRRLVIRLLRWYEVGLIKGKVVYPKYTDITVTAYLDDTTEVYKQTKAFYFGYFFLTCMEPGTYDIVFEAEGYSGRENDVVVKAGRIVNLGRIRLSEIPAATEIEVTVTYIPPMPDSTEDVSGGLLHVTTFSEGGNLQYNTIETQTFDMTSNQVTVKLDNFGDGYDIGAYEIQAHIDVDGDGKLTKGHNNDFVALGRIDVSDQNSSTEINGPWGFHSAFIVVNAPLPSDVDGDSDLMYLIVVAEGHTWGNYTYGYRKIESIAAAPSVSIWAPYGVYNFLAMIDVGNDSPGVPEEDDYIYSKIEEWTTGEFPTQDELEWSKWSLTL